MRPKERWRIYLQIVEDQWDGTSKVTCETFFERLSSWRSRLRTDIREELPDPSPQTFSLVWKEFCRRHKLRRGVRRTVRETLLRGVSEGAWDPGAPDEEAAAKAARYLSQQGIIPPVLAELIRRIRTIRTHLRRRKQEARDAAAVRRAVVQAKVVQRAPATPPGQGGLMCD